MIIDDLTINMNWFVKSDWDLSFLAVFFPAHFATPWRHQSPQVLMEPSTKTWPSNLLAQKDFYLKISKQLEKTSMSRIPVLCISWSKSTNHLLLDEIPLGCLGKIPFSWRFFSMDWRENRLEGNQRFSNQSIDFGHPIHHWGTTWWLTLTTHVLHTVRPYKLCHVYLIYSSWNTMEIPHGNPIKGINLH